MSYSIEVKELLFNCLGGNVMANKEQKPNKNDKKKPQKSIIEKRKEKKEKKKGNAAQ
jgi:hypothetical protein